MARMRIAGHTMGTPEYTVPEAIDLFARLAMEGIEAIVHDEYRSAIRTDISAAGLRELRQRADVNIEGTLNVGVRTAVPPPADPPDLSRARTRLGYRPKYDLRRGLATYIEWYRGGSTSPET